MSVKRGILRLKLHLSYINLPFILRVSYVYLSCILRVSIVYLTWGIGGGKEERRRRKGRKMEGEGGEIKEKWKRNGGEKLYFSFLFA